jgi:hypothetical protein
VQLLRDIQPQCADLCAHGFGPQSVAVCLPLHHCGAVQEGYFFHGGEVHLRAIVVVVLLLLLLWVLVGMGGGMALPLARRIN